jgi:hypothetical protein
VQILCWIEIYGKEEAIMACIAPFAQPLAMATTEFARAIQHEEAFTWQTEAHVERKSLRLSWVVVTDNEGRRQLRMQWAAGKC